MVLDIGFHTAQIFKRGCDVSRCRSRRPVSDYRARVPAGHQFSRRRQDHDHHDKCEQGRVRRARGAKPRLRRIFGAAALAAASSAIAVTLYALVIRALGVPMRAGFIGAAAASSLKIGSFAMGAIICTFWGTLIAAALSRFASQPRTRIVQVAVVLTAVSLVVPLGAADTAGTTKIALVGAHVLAALIIIPALARGVTEPVN